MRTRRHGRGVTCSGAQGCPSARGRWGEEPSVDRARSVGPRQCRRGPTAPHYHLSMTIGAATVRAARARSAVGWTSWFGPPRWSLAQQYVVASLIVVLAGVLVTGAWIGHQIESSVLDRTAGITALYVDSFLSGSLQGLAQDDRWLTATDTAALDRLISDTGLGEGVVLFKIWSLDGRVLCSPDRSLVNQRFPVEGGLASATRGEVHADMTTLEQPENANERGRYNRLVEVYAPVREDNGPRIIAVNEFYLLPDALDAEIRDAQLRSW